MVVWSKNHGIIRACEGPEPDGAPPLPAPERGVGPPYALARPALHALARAGELLAAAHPAGAEARHLRRLGVVGRDSVPYGERAAPVLAGGPVAVELPGTQRPHLR